MTKYKQEVIGKVSRRNMLKLLVAAGASCLSGAQANSIESSFLRRSIPSSGESIPAIGLGTARTFDVGESPDERQQLGQVLGSFVEQGGALVDSSPMYGRAESVVGDLAAGMGIQRSLFYATKVWTSGRKEGVRQMETSMRRLRTERIDLIQVHNLVDTQTHLETLREWKQRDRIRYLGVTHYRTDAYEELSQVIRKHALDFVQFNYSLLTREAENWLLPLCADRGVAVIVNRPFENGELFRLVGGKPLPEWSKEFDCQSWAQFFLKYILSHPATSVVIPATSKPRHLLDNMQAGLGRLPDVAMRKKMVEVFQRI
jgi:diketogulonate reductase-like aldo/keto reductase